MLILLKPRRALQIFFCVFESWFRVATSHIEIPKSPKIAGSIAVFVDNPKSARRGMLLLDHVIAWLLARLGRVAYSYNLPVTR